MARRTFVTKRRVPSGMAASQRCIHSASPILTSRRVRIINGKGATCKTWDGIPGILGWSTNPSH